MIKLKSILLEKIFPSEFNRNMPGSCMVAAEISAKYLLSKGIKNFKVTEGWVSLSPDIAEDDTQWQEHTWIEFSNGKIFDPTRHQWREWGYDPDGVTIEKIKKKKDIHPL